MKKRIALLLLALTIGFGVNAVPHPAAAETTWASDYWN